MKLIIDIPEYIYKLCQGHRDIVYKYIAKGIPFPKNCRLIDANALPNEIQSLYSIRIAPTIIEADGGDGE